MYLDNHRLLSTTNSTPKDESSLLVGGAGNEVVRGKDDNDALISVDCTIKSDRQRRTWHSSANERVVGSAT
jgi:hypothetical protein